MYYKMKEYFKNEMKQLREELTESSFNNLDDLINIIMVGKDVIFVKDDETVSDAIVDENETEEHGYEMLWEAIQISKLLKNCFGCYLLEVYMSINHLSIYSRA